MQAFVDNASRSTAINGAINIKQNQLPQRRFIDPSNPLASSSTNGAVDNHLDGTRIITYDEFSTFIASSSLVHALDGWGYLAHSIESFLKGDQGISVHLGYYAELRGIMSFLSSEGIAILDYKHLSTDANNGIVKYPRDHGTHKFAWDVLEKYLLSANKPKDDILKIFQYNGKSFLEWRNAIPNSTAVISDQIITDWLKKWTFDVQLFKSDQSLRNEVSYRPRMVVHNPSIDLDLVLPQLSSYWKLLEPQNSSKFKLLDQFLIKKFFKETHATVEIALGRNVDFNKFLEDSFTTLRLQLTPAEKSFFNSNNDHQLFVAANNTTLNNGHIDPLSTIARATLLLRLCIGYSSNDLQTAGISKNDLNFIMQVVGKNNGFWNTNTPAQFSSLWDDVGSSVEEITDWCMGRTSPISLEELNLELASELTFYKQFNRAGLWGMNC